MGAFIGYNEIGVWASNSERDAFLDWFADHRCLPGDARWRYCLSEENRWMGCCIELEDLLPKGQRLELTPEEYSCAVVAFWPHFAQLLGIIETITRGEWRIAVDSRAAVNWRRPSGQYPELGIRRTNEIQ